MLPEEYKVFCDEILAFIEDDRVITDPMKTIAYGTDASFYRLIPKVVVNVDCEDEVVQIIKIANRMNLPMTFRAAGTSLSGQAVTDSILVRLHEGFMGYRIFDNASKVSLEPNIIGSQANRLLAEFDRKIGPDPASIDSCKIGGILANNASGMCCGVAENSYKTLSDIRVVLADGTVLDTADDKSCKEFERRRPDIIKGLLALRDGVRENKTLADRIERKFKIKNTTGYSLNALVDFENPFDILKHLVVGSEGTLAFISEVTYHTVVEHRHKASALIFFPDMEKACTSAAILRKQPVSAVELMDRPALRSVENKAGMPEGLADLADGAAALLVETRAESEEALKANIDTVVASLAEIEKVKPIEFTDKPEEFGRLWLVRKGLFPAVGAVRRTGTTVIIEDVAFPIEKLAPATLELQDFFKKYNYDEAIIFGHALEGNLHFVFTQDFTDEKEVERYRDFMDEICEMVVKRYDGSLKAEHGTGRNMAPFVEMEWGRDAYQLMKDIKSLFDPKGLLNPGVIINDDAEAHLKDLKGMPAAHEIVDKCIECGFCEPVCPSQTITFTPRHRITGWREISRRTAAGEEIGTLKASYDYNANATCATDGLCATRCPVGINTGAFIKELRASENTDFAKSMAAKVAKNFKNVERSVRFGLKMANGMEDTFGSTFMKVGSRMLRMTSSEAPVWLEDMPTAGKGLPKVKGNSGSQDVVYFPSCISRSMGPNKSNANLESLPDVTVRLLQKAGFNVIVAPEFEGMCCGMPFMSKGFKESSDTKGRELEALLLKLTDNGEIPVLSDTSPCVLHMKESYDERLKIYEPVEFIHDVCMDKLKFTPVDESIAVHSTCSARKMGLDTKFAALAKACANDVVVPTDVNCCGFAGDRGFSYPELNKASLSNLPGQVEHCSSGYSNSRTCEIGLSIHGKIPYQSIIYLVDKVTEPA